MVTRSGIGKKIWLAVGKDCVIAELALGIGLRRAPLTEIGLSQRMQSPYLVFPRQGKNQLKGIVRAAQKFYLQPHALVENQ